MLAKESYISICNAKLDFQNGKLHSTLPKWPQHYNPCTKNTLFIEISSQKTYFCSQTPMMAMRSW